MSKPSLADYWHPIARSEEVTDHPRQFTLLGQKLVAFRDESGVACFKDLCIHRGSALSLGWIENGHLTCRYHGWQYDRTGACVKIPSLPPGATIPRKARAIVYQADERYGLVWAAPGEPVAPIPSWPSDEFGAPGWRSFLSYDRVWETSAGRAVENFMDPTHFAFVHEGMLGSRDRTEAVPHPVEITDYGCTYAFEAEEPATLQSAAGELVHWAWRLYSPFTIHLTKTTPRGRKTIISLACTPIEPKLVRLYMFVGRNYDLDRPDDSFRDFSNTLMEQDRVIVESQRPEEIPLALRDELHLKVPDASGLGYRKILAEIDRVGAFMP